MLMAILVVVTLSLTTNIFGKTLKTSKIGDGDDTRPNIPINSTIGTVSSSIKCSKMFDYINLVLAIGQT